MMSEGKFMIRKWKAGKTVVMSKFPVGNATKPRAKKKKGATPSYKKMQNDMSAVRTLTRTIDCNFKHGDFWITLKYDDGKYQKLLSKLEAAGMELTPDNIRLEAIHERDLFLRRVKRNMTEKGLDLQYVSVTSDIDGDTGNAVRVHHHILVNKEAFEFIFKHWRKDILRYDPLRDQDSYAALAEYLIRQVRRQPEKKKYTTSKNLKKPELISEAVVSDSGELVVPKGAKVLQRSPYDVDKNPSQYICYVPKAEKKKRGGKRE